VFIHEQPEWPEFTWDEKQLMHMLLAFCHTQGRILGKMASLFSLESQTFQKQTLKYSREWI
jgi:hypothetical protein